MISIAIVLFAALPTVSAPTPRNSVEPRGNILILLLDDIGVDGLTAYGLGSDLPSTPNIDVLAASGMLFENVWSNPVCSPTRSTIQTGRYGFRTGIGYTVTSYSQGLSTAEVTLPEMLRISGVSMASGAFGKWHLNNGNNGDAFSPNVAGYDHYSGALRNLHPPEDYFSWNKTTNGNLRPKTGYITSDTVNDASGWINNQTGPWLAYVAFHAPHSPHHVPPQDLHSVNLSGVPGPSIDPRPFWRAMVEAVDTEIGRLFIEIDLDLENTTVFLLGDNGTNMRVIVPPFIPSHGKGTAYEGGIHVPMIIAGPGITQSSTCSALVNTTDIFATVAEISRAKYGPLFPDVAPGWRQLPAIPGFSVPLAQLDNTLDSISLVPYFDTPDLPTIRKFAWAELFRPSSDVPPTTIRQAIRNQRFKLLMRTTPTGGSETFFFDLSEDSHELINLLDFGELTGDQLKAFNQLVKESIKLLSSK